MLHCFCLSDISHLNPTIFMKGRSILYINIDQSRCCDDKNHNSDPTFKKLQSDSKIWIRNPYKRFMICIVFLFFQECVSGFDKKKKDPGLCTLNEILKRFLKNYQMNNLDKFKSRPFCFHTFGVRRSIDVLDSENQPGSGSRAQGFTVDVWHQKYENKKDSFYII